MYVVYAYLIYCSCPKAKYEIAIPINENHFKDTYIVLGSTPFTV